MKLYVLDSTVFLEGYAKEFIGKPCVSVYEIIDEVKSGHAKIELEMAMRSGLDLTEPSKASVERIEKMRDKTKDKLSNTDIKLLALALELKKREKDTILVTDDYAMQNIAKFLDIKYLSVSEKGIREKFVWKRFCKSCGKPTDNEICDICGSETAFKPRRR